MVVIAKAFVTESKSSPAYWQIGNLWQVMATGVQTGDIRPCFTSVLPLMSKTLHR